VYQGEQLPLAIYLPLAAQGEAVKPLVVAHITEDRFDGGEVSTVLLAAGPAIDALAHALGMRDVGFAREHDDLP
jgi:hypothetical protein